jgi:hypothetical protein
LMLKLRENSLYRLCWREQAFPKLNITQNFATQS